MRRTLIVLASVAAALGASAGEAAASGGIGQVADDSIGVVQVGSVDVSPQTAASVDADTDAPITVASGHKTAATGGHGSSSTSSTSSRGGHSGSGGHERQTADDSIGVVQVGSVDVSPQTAASVDADTDAPVSGVAAERHSRQPGSPGRGITTHGGKTASEPRAGAAGRTERGVGLCPSFAAGGATAGVPLEGLVALVGLWLAAALVRRRPSRT